MMQDIDFVITWVDGNDPAWKAEREKYISGNDDATEVRFRDWGLLRYWFRCVEKFAPWVRKIHFVTCGQLPDWLNTEHPKLNCVNHKDFIPEQYLPTFNSRAIEVFLHNIPGLAEQFVYFNDDMFIVKPVKPEYFFREGLPCDSFGLDCICFEDDTIGWGVASDIAVINNHFNLRDVLWKNRRKIFSVKNGIRQVNRSLILGALYPFFPGIRFNHAPLSYLKSSFQTVWAAESSLMEEAARCRFRSKATVNHFVVKYWQLASGQFVPVNSNRHCCVQLTDSNIGEAASIITSQRYQTICLNDTKNVTDIAKASETLISMFEIIVSDISEYEK